MGNKLYVGNFPWSTTESELEELFAQYGDLRSVKIITDKETGRSRGFAFIEFVNADDAVAAMESENGRDMGGRELKVREAVDKARMQRNDARPPRQDNHAMQAPQQPPPDRSNGNVKRQRENRSSRREDRDYND